MTAMKWVLCAALLLGSVSGWAEDAAVISRGDLDLRVGVKEQEETYPPLVYKSQDESGGCNLATQGDPITPILYFVVLSLLLMRQKQCRI